MSSVESLIHAIVGAEVVEEVAVQYSWMTEPLRTSCTPPLVVKREAGRTLTDGWARTPVQK